jgi:hypothetical protein
LSLSDASPKEKFHMNKHLFKSAALSAILMLGTAGFVAHAVEVNVGGTSANTGSTGSDAVSGTTTVDNVANGQFDANGNLVGFNIGPGGGPLVTANQGGNPANNTSSTAANVNLGSLLDGIDVGGMPGTPGAPGAAGGAGGGGAGGPQGVLASLSAADRGVVKLRCSTVLKSPRSFKADVVQFCQLVAKM